MQLARRAGSLTHIALFSPKGLPVPQEHHAEILSHFAVRLLEIFDRVIPQLAKSLGANTANLGLRVGLHSGEVTGGVLRCSKKRFQLFGDTMNTASRMESNGLPGRIHVSQQFVDELAARGKESWAVPRDDKILVKGKGELQTYWLVHPFPTEPDERISAPSDYAV